MRKTKATRRWLLSVEINVLFAEATEMSVAAARRVERGVAHLVLW